MDEFIHGSFPTFDTAKEYVDGDRTLDALLMDQNKWMQAITAFGPTVQGPETNCPHSYKKKDGDGSCCNGGTNRKCGHGSVDSRCHNLPRRHYCKGSTPATGRYVPSMVEFWTTLGTGQKTLLDAEYEMNEQCALRKEGTTWKITSYTISCSHDNKLQMGDQLTFDWHAPTGQPNQHTHTLNNWHCVKDLKFDWPEPWYVEGGSSLDAVADLIQIKPALQKGSVNGVPLLPLPAYEESSCGIDCMGKVCDAQETFVDKCKVFTSANCPPTHCKVVGNACQSTLDGKFDNAARELQTPLEMGEMGGVDNDIPIIGWQCLPKTSVVGLIERAFGTSKDENIKPSPILEKCALNGIPDGQTIFECLASGLLNVESADTSVHTDIVARLLAYAGTALLNGVDPGMVGFDAKVFHDPAWVAAKKKFPLWDKIKKGVLESLVEAPLMFFTAGAAYPLVQKINQRFHVRGVAEVFKGVHDEVVKDYNKMMGKEPPAPPSPLFRTMHWATSKADQWLPDHMDTMPAFSTSDVNTQGAPCDCGGAVPMYKTSLTPWDKLDAAQKPYDAINWKPESRHAMAGLAVFGYGWDTATDAFRDQQPVGLWIPSNPRYSRVTLRERDFLDPVTSETNLDDLIHRYFTDEFAPVCDDPTDPHGKCPLVKELLYSVNPEGPIPYKTRTFEYKFGSCMRWPYGMVPFMSMSKTDQEQYFGDVSGDDSYTVEDESLIGYCETDKIKRHYYCINDGMKSTKREEFCETDRAKRVVVGSAIRGQTIDSVCNPTDKTCLIIPNSPFFPDINSLVKAKRDLTGYAILITPFHWETVAGFMYDRWYFIPGSGEIDKGKRILRDLDPKDTATTGMEGLESEEFQLLTHNTYDVVTIQRLVGTMVAKLNCSTGCLLPWLDDMEPVDSDRVFAPVSFNRQNIKFDDVTVMSAEPARNLRFKRPPADKDSPLPCTQFYVSGKRFLINDAHEAMFDNSECKSMAPLDRAAVVFGGAEVQDTTLHITTIGAEMPVAFVGDDTSSFTKARLVNIGVANIALIEASDVLYAVGAARANGTINITGTNNAPVLIQPYTWSGPPDPIDLAVIGKGSSIINISRYTALFGNGIMAHLYEKHPQLIDHAAYPLFGILIAVNVAMLTYFLVFLFR